MSELTDRFLATQKKIKHIQRPLNQTVQLLAVSKTRSADEVLEVYNEGQRAFGENYIQEAVDKIDQLSQYNIEWHFIGPLQSNKSRLAAEHFQWVHTIDRLKIAKRLNDQRPAHLPPLNVCLQINIDQESTKSGFNAEQISAAALEISQLPRLTLRGIMAIPAASNSEKEQYHAFTRLANLLETTKQHLNQHQLPTDQFDTLSMGMSGDVETAIQCGATIVRIGTDIFGPRPAKNT